MIVIISQYFYPSHASTSQLMTDLARGLADSDYTVKVYTGTPSNSNELNYDLQIMRSPDPFQESKSIFGKLVSSLFFLCGALFYVIFKVDKTASLLIASNPPYAGIIGVIFKLIRGRKYYFLLQDVFPESAILSEILKPESKIAFWLKKLIHLICKNAANTIVLNASMKRLLESNYPDLDNFTIIENWSIENIPLTTKENNSFAIQHGLDKKFTVLYSGNIGRLHDIETIAQAIKLLNVKNPHIQFVFIGDGPKLKLLQDYQNQFCLKNLLLLPFQPREILSQTLTACDVSLVSLISGAESVVAPCKLYGMLASGRGIVSISAPNSYIDQLLINYGCGINVTPGDYQHLASVISQLASDNQKVKLMGEKARQLYETRYTFKRSLDEYKSLIFGIQTDT